MQENTVPICTFGSMQQIENARFMLFLGRKNVGKTFQYLREIFVIKIDVFYPKQRLIILIRLSSDPR